MSAKNEIKIENLPSRTPFRRRRKVCPFSGENGVKIDYKDPKMLLRYMSEKGKIVPSRISAVSLRPVMPSRLPKRQTPVKVLTVKPLS